MLLLGPRCTLRFRLTKRIARTRVNIQLLTSFAALEVVSEIPPRRVCNSEEEKHHAGEAHLAEKEFQANCSRFQGVTKSRKLTVLDQVYVNNSCGWALKTHDENENSMSTIRRPNIGRLRRAHGCTSLASAPVAASSYSFLK